MARATEKYYGTGRRKSSCARVWVRPGTGRVIINKRSPENYFGGRITARMVVDQACEALGLSSQCDVFATVRGGGSMGQAQAIRHGITRALIKRDPQSKSLLRKAGYVTRDSRRVERKKVGRKGARKEEQFSKR